PAAAPTPAPPRGGTARGGRAAHPPSASPPGPRRRPRAAHRHRSDRAVEHPCEHAARHHRHLATSGVRSSTTLRTPTTPRGGPPYRGGMAGLRVAVIGAEGRMGRTVCDAVEKADDLELVARLDVGDDIGDLAGAADVGVDFTVPDAAEANVHALLDAGMHAVVGTTGWQDAALQRVRDRLADTPLGVVVAP